MDSHLEVDYSVEDLQCGDLLFISSDGCHDFLAHNFLQQALLAIAPDATNDTLEVEAKKLVTAALENGCDDNCSCLLLRIDSLPEQELEEVQNKHQCLLIGSTKNHHFQSQYLILS